MVCGSCTWFNQLWCWLSNLLCSIKDSNLFTIFLAILVSLVLIWNLYSGFLICQQSNDVNQGATAANNCAVQPTRATNQCNYGYGPTNGPHTWNTADNNQSPINIDTHSVERKYFESSLMWFKYEDLPAGLRLENNGNTLVLRAAFNCRTPFIDGVDLLGRFEFHEISFRWSWYNASGSEHTINNVHYPLEMQCMHISESCQTPGETSSRAILMISYMFELSEDNPYLDVLIQHLVAVQQAEQCVEIPPFPLRYLMPAFYTDFYSYHGSLTEPPCHRGAEWFIYSVPLAIGERQLNEFRALRSKSGGRIGLNARPVQELGDRYVFFNLQKPPGRRCATRNKI